MRKFAIASIILLIVLSVIAFFNTKMNKDDDKMPLSGNKQVKKVVKEKEENDIPVKDVEVIEDDIPAKYKKYENLTGFLNNQTISGDLNPVEDDFVVCLSGEEGTSFTPIYNKKLKNGKYDFKEVKYDYMKLIDDALEEDCVYAGYGTESSTRGQVVFERDVRHPLKETIDDVFNRRENVFELLDELESTAKKGEKHTELQAYLYDFVGEYNKAEKMREEKLDNNKSTKVVIQGKIKDGEGNPLSDAKITLLNDNEQVTNTNKKGEYKLEFESYPLSHLRIRVTKRGYSDGYYSIYLDHSKDPSWTKKVKKNIVLNKADKVVEINFNNEEKIKNVMGKDYYVIKTSQSRYHVPVRELYYKNGDKFNGDKLKVYLYEFKKTTNLESLVEMDTFSPVYGYVGNLMKTFGMPYIQFIDKNGEEVFVKKSNPMLLINKIYHMDALFENQAEIYSAITTGDMEKLVEKSKKEGGYPITYEWQTDNQFLRWPTWWTLDREKGTWVSVPHKVIDKSGVVQLKFYQIEE